MTAPLSIVIPTLGVADRIGPCLGALTQGVFDGLIREVILVDGGSDDNIAEIAETTGATFLTARRGRGPQFACGARAATGEWLLFLHADTVLQPGWVQAIRTHIECDGRKAGYFDLSFDQGGPMASFTAFWANWRSRLLALPYGDQALLIPASLYREIGGYPELPLMEDVALIRRLGRRRIAPLKARALTSAERYVAEGWLRRGLRNITTLLLYRLGTKPEKLVAWYENR
ncbi:MAG: TIGR04283 family arsenosugar biosynthesis glycosyltransferase [Pseudomonadota bacterium]